MQAVPEKHNSFLFASVVTLTFALRSRAHHGNFLCVPDKFKDRRNIAFTFVSVSPSVVVYPSKAMSDIKMLVIKL